MAQTVEHIRTFSPGVIVIGDAKRGDISSSSAAYATAMFDQWGFDAVTVNGYLGRDSVEPFLAYEGCGALCCAKLPTPDAGEFQDIQDKDGVPLYQRVARAVGGWSADGNLGLVVGATYPTSLRRCGTFARRCRFSFPAWVPRPETYGRQSLTAPTPKADAPSSALREASSTPGAAGLCGSGSAGGFHPARQD